MSATVAAVMLSIWRSIAVNSSTIVAPGPLTYTLSPGGGASPVAVSRSICTESSAAEVPSMPASRTMTLTARPSALSAPDAVVGSDHRSVTEYTSR